MNTLAASSTTAHACNCIGPQNGQPVCPCMMRFVAQRDGRWVKTEVDLGPVSTSVVTVTPEAPGFHEHHLPELCRDSNHLIPTSLYIPSGQKYVHYCPTCKHKSVAFGIAVTC